MIICIPLSAHVCHFLNHLFSGICSLGNCNISDAGVCMLAGALRVNQTLQKLKWVCHLCLTFSSWMGSDWGWVVVDRRENHSGVLIAGNVMAAGTRQRERKGCSWTNIGYGPLKSGMYTVDCLLSPYLHCVCIGWLSMWNKCNLVARLHLPAFYCAMCAVSGAWEQGCRLNRPC